MNDYRCLYTQVSRLIAGKEEYTSRVAPIRSLRNKPNEKGITYKYGKKAGQLKPEKHKDCNE